MDTEMNLFDIVGPVMIGPSSSHTAGAARIGRIALHLLGEPVLSAEVGFHGSFAKTWRGHGTDRAIVGGLMDMATDDLRLRDSLSLAEEAGLTIRFEEVELRSAHPNTVRIRAQGIHGARIEVVAASIGGGSIEVRSIDGMELCFTGSQPTLIVRHRDVPGMIATVSGMLAQEQVNIATMRVSRRSQGGEAMMAIEMDALPRRELVGRLERVEGVTRATLLEKIG